MNVSELDLIFPKNFNKKYSNTKKILFFYKSQQKLEFLLGFLSPLGGGPLKFLNVLCVCACVFSVGKRTTKLSTAENGEI